MGEGARNEEHSKRFRDGKGTVKSSDTPFFFENHVVHSVGPYYIKGLLDKKTKKERDPPFSESLNSV
jgi:hypothetical protein